MAQFKVVIGTHIEGHKAYNKGDIVDSETDLMAAFPGKFTGVEYHKPPPTKPPIRPPKPPGDTGDADAETAKEKEEDWEEPAPTKTTPAAAKPAAKHRG